MIWRMPSATTTRLKKCTRSDKNVSFERQAVESSMLLFNLLSGFSQLFGVAWHSCKLRSG